MARKKKAPEQDTLALAVEEAAPTPPKRTSRAKDTPKDTLPSGNTREEAFFSVGTIWEGDLPPKVQKDAKKLLPESKDRQRCIEELSRTARNEGYTYGQVLDAYAECVSGRALLKKRSGDSLESPEVLIGDMRQSLDSLERHYPVDTRIDTKAGSLPVVNTPEDVARYYRDVLPQLPQEQLRVIWLNTKNEVVGQHMAHQGTVDSSVVRGVDVLRPPLVAGVSKVIMVHNHPSGDPTPSGADVAVTKELYLAAQKLDMELLDHVVIGREGRDTSIREMDRTVFERQPAGIREGEASYQPEGAEEMADEEELMTGEDSNRQNASHLRLEQENIDAALKRCESDEGRNVVNLYALASAYQGAAKAAYEQDADELGDEWSKLGDEVHKEASELHEGNKEEQFAPGMMDMSEESGQDQVQEPVADYLYSSSADSFDDWSGQDVPAASFGGAGSMDVEMPGLQEDAEPGGFPDSSGEMGVMSGQSVTAVKPPPARARRPGSGHAFYGRTERKKTRRSR